jgi:hypothetical protein
MKRALFLRIPQSMPHVSRLRRVFCDALARNWARNCAGRKTGRRGSPFSRKAEGLKVNSSSSLDGVGGRSAAYLAGTGGAPEVYLPGTGGGWNCPYGSDCEGVCGFGGSGGGMDGVPEVL